MGGRSTKVVEYDPSVQSAKMKHRAIELLSTGEREATKSRYLANEYGQQAVTRLDEGLSLLGEYLSDRNAVTSNTTPIYQGFLSGVQNIDTHYNDRVSSMFEQGE